MSYHSYTLQKHNEKLEEEEHLTNAIEAVLLEIVEKHPNILPDNEDTCFNIGYDIVTNDYDIDTYIEEHLTNEEN